MCLIRTILWILTAAFIGAGLFLKGTTASILLFVAAFLVMPLPKLRKFVEKILGKVLRVVLIVALILVAIFLTPEVLTYFLNLIT